LSPRVRMLINDMQSEWGELDRRIHAFDNEFAARAREGEDTRRLATIARIESEGSLDDLRPPPHRLLADHRTQADAVCLPWDQTEPHRKVATACKTPGLFRASPRFCGTRR